MTPSERDLAQRGVLALAPAGCVLWLWHACHDVNWTALGAIPCLGVIAIILYPSWAAVIGEQMTEFLFWPHRRERPRAPLSRVDYFLVNEQWDAAELLLEDLGRRFPYDLAVWTRLFRVVWLRPDDVERARAAHWLALRASDDPALWPKLNHVYLLFAQCSLGEGKELAAEQRAVERRVEVAAGRRPAGRTTLSAAAGFFQQY